MSSSKNTVTLYELNHLVSKVIESEMPSEYWVEAELSECRESRGHCYMELIQKDERTATPIAKASAKWPKSADKTLGAISLIVIC
jgi:exodeoxyribonuclease VII large subunit